MLHSEAIELRVELDPWTKLDGNRLPMPQGVCLACLCELHAGADSIPELVCFHRTRTHDELWVAWPDADIDRIPFPEILDCSETRGRVARAPRGGRERDSARRLLKALVRSRVGFGWPVQWYAGDLVDEPAYMTLLDELSQGLDRNARAARKQKAPIIETARRLRLGPEPTCTSPVAWQARCPGANHYLYISSASNSFGCGWCRRKGGPEELEAFAVERTRRASAISATRQHGEKAQR